MPLLPMKFHAFIGPRHVAEDDTTSPYGKWNWVGDISDPLMASPPPPVKYLGKGTLGTSMTPTSTSLNVTGITLPPAAGVWVGPNGTDEGWEYMAYYTPSGSKVVTREVQPPQNGTHTAGAQAYLWFPLAMNNGTLQYDEEQSDNMATITWTAKLSGVQAPATVLKPEHILLVVGSYDMTDLASEMPILLIGTIDRVQMSQDSANNGSWEIDIVGSSKLLQQSIIPGLRFGDLDIALQSNVDASSSLGAFWKLNMPQQMEIEAGTRTELDLVEYQQDAGPQNTVDGNEDTVWVSDGWLGNRATYGNLLDPSPGHETWASVFCYPVPEYPFGTKYIEIINTKWLDAANMYCFAKWWTPDASGSPRSRWYLITEDDFFQSQGLDSGALHPDNTKDNEKRLIIAEDLSIFQKVFPAAKANFMVDGLTLSGQRDLEDPRRVWWEGGALFFALDTGETHRHDWLFSWGNVTDTELVTVWDANNLASFDLPDTRYHVPLTGVRPGMVIRRNLAQAINPADGAGQTMSYLWDYIIHPGYVINTDINADNTGNPSYRSEWIKWVLPEMSHILLYDINAGDTVITIVDSQNNPNVEGISKHNQAGVIFIDDEAITFTGKDYKQGILTGCTVTRRHKKGSKILVQWTSTAWGRINLGEAPGIPAGYRIPQDGRNMTFGTTAYPIKRFEWGRGYHHDDGTERFPFAGNFLIRFSLDPDAPDPTTDSYDNAYFNDKIVDSQNAAYAAQHVPNAVLDVTKPPFPPMASIVVPGGASSVEAFRPRTILMQLREMWQFGGAAITARPMLNYFRAIVDRDFFNPDTWLDTSDGVTDNEDGILAAMNLSGQYDVMFQSDPTGSITRNSRKHGQTDRDVCWKVVSDMADYGTSVLKCQRTGKIFVSQNLYLLKTSHAATFHLTDHDVSSVEIVNVRQSEVGQVRVIWEDPFQNVQGVVRYPDTARYGGGTIDIGPLLLDNETMATTVAKNFYLTKRYPYNVFIDLWLGDWDAYKCGVIFDLTYDFLNNGQKLYKLLMIESVSQSITAGVHHTQLGCREIDRDSV